MQNYIFCANLRSIVKTEFEVVPVLLFDIVCRLPVLMWHFFVSSLVLHKCLRRHEWLIPVWILWWETLISRFQEYFFSCSFFISFLSDILVPVNSVTDTDKKLSAGLGVVNPARLKQLRLFTYTNCFFTKHLSSFRRNIARIANAVQVTICLLVSTSVY